MRMRPTSALLLTQAWGILCGGLLGALRTREAAHFLLAKNQALVTAGIPALPGTDHWATMAGSGPTLAGALFFGLSVGLGWGTLYAAAALLRRALPRRARLTALALYLLPPTWAVGQGDLGLAAGLLAMAGGALALFYESGTASVRSLMPAAVVAFVIAFGLGTWAKAPEGAFTRLRDRHLLTTSWGLALDQFYYRWALYPAEALKPLRARSQPTVSVPVEVEGAASFCAEVLALGIFCVEEGLPGADLRAAPGQGAWFLQAGGITSPWPATSAARHTWWADFSRDTDSRYALRKTTAVGLFLGCPAALCSILAVLCLVATRVVLPGPSRPFTALLPLSLAAFLAVILWLSGRPDATLEDIQATLRSPQPASLKLLEEQLASPNPVNRFYAAREAWRLGAPALPLLLQARSDPIINVRYAATQSLGSLGGRQARNILIETLSGSDDWYVKERAYSALWRMGWRPQ